MKRMRRIGSILLGLSMLVGCVTAAPLADLRIYDRTDGRVLPVYWHEGKAYVVGKPGNEYQLQVTNRSGGDVMTVLSVDGVNVVTGETASSGQNGYVFYAGQQYDIQGWRKNQNQTAAFYFTSVSDSYAGRTGRPGNVGVIGMAVFQRKVVPPPPPVTYSVPSPMEDRKAPAMESESSSTSARADEMAKPASPSAASGMEANKSRSVEKLGTGHGRIERSDVQEVEFERASSRPAQVVTVYYDSYSNLVARGVIRTKPSAPKAPQAFPGETRYVPDPPR